MKTEDTKIPWITLIFLIVTAFVPIVQLIMLQGQGLIFTLLERTFGITDVGILKYLNLGGAIFSLTAFYLTKKTGLKIFFTITTVFFLFSFLIFISNDLNYDALPYFAPLLFIGFLVSLPLLIIGILKEKKSHFGNVSNT